MDVNVSPDRPLTPEEYLILEAQGVVKHEYIDGYVHAMAGASKAHNLISLNIATGLRSQLTTPCQTFMADMKVMARENRRYYYPDVVVTCDDPDDLDADRVHCPALIVEVLSESTESFDRGDKFHDYSSLPSLQAYLLVSSRHYVVDYFQRATPYQWLVTTYVGLEGIIPLKFLNLSLSLADIYDGVNLSPG
jgi:Uma2 family endonuclease